jgi:hypothetical protein
VNNRGSEVTVEPGSITVWGLLLKLSLLSFDLSMAPFPIERAMLADFMFTEVCAIFIGKSYPEHFTANGNLNNLPQGIVVKPRLRGQIMGLNRLLRSGPGRYPF